MNEPLWLTPIEPLKEFYRQAEVASVGRGALAEAPTQAVIREVSPALVLLYHDAFRFITHSHIVLTLN